MSEIPNECATCKKPSKKTCSRCKSVAYCGRECQKKAWKAHKRVCKPVEETSSLSLPPPPPQNPTDAEMNAAAAIKATLPPDAAAKALTPMELQELLSSSSEARSLRDKVDQVTNMTNEGNHLMSCNRINAAQKTFQEAASEASALLSAMESHRPKPHSEVTKLQKLVMTLFVSTAHALSSAMTSLAQIKEMSGSAREALIMYQCALPQCEAVQDVEQAFACRVGVGTCHIALKEFERAINVLTLEHETAKIGKDLVGEAICCGALSKAYVSLPYSDNTADNLNRALQYAQRDVELSADDDGQLGSARAQLASVLVKAGDFAEAIVQYNLAISLQESAKDFPAALVNMLEFGHMLTCEVPSNGVALEMGRRALELAKELKDGESANQALSICVRAGSREHTEAFHKCIKLPEKCSICEDELCSAPIFVATRSCGCAHHKSCLLTHIANDNLDCPKCKVHLPTFTPTDPRICLRIANGEAGCLNYL